MLKCNRARIKVYMVTGDHPITAAAIAKQVNIIDQKNIDDGSAIVTNKSSGLAYPRLISFSSLKTANDAVKSSPSPATVSTTPLPSRRVTSALLWVSPVRMFPRKLPI